MKLYLVRHGKANSELVDPEKNLSEEGKEQAQKVAAYLKTAGVSVQKVFHSGKARAEQTAEILANVVHEKGRINLMEGITPLDEPSPIADSLGEQDVMLVGHNPFTNKLASLLIAGKESADCVQFEAAACLCLEKTEGKWRIAWMVTPSSI